KITAEILIGLADQTGRLQTVRGRVSQQERCEGVAGILRLVVWDRRGQLRKREASVGPVLAAPIPTVPCVEEPGSKRVDAANDGKVVGDVFIAAAVEPPRRPAPSRVGSE